MGGPRPPGPHSSAPPAPARLAPMNIVNKKDLINLFTISRFECTISFSPVILTSDYL